MHADRDLEPLRRKIASLCINLKFAPKKEHVPEIEHFIWTVRERARSARAAMSFTIIYKLMIVNLVTSAIFWLNEFPPSTPGSGMSYTKGPRQLVLGTMVD